MFYYRLFWFSFPEDCVLQPAVSSCYSAAFAAAQQPDCRRGEATCRCVSGVEVNINRLPGNRHNNCLTQSSCSGCGLGRHTLLASKGGEPPPWPGQTHPRKMVMLTKRKAVAQGSAERARQVLLQRE